MAIAELGALEELKLLFCQLTGECRNEDNIIVSPQNFEDTPTSTYIYEGNDCNVSLIMWVLKGRRA